jgi:hypothetical protein
VNKFWSGFTIVGVSVALFVMIRRLLDLGETLNDLTVTQNQWAVMASAGLPLLVGGLIGGGLAWLVFPYRKHLTAKTVMLALLAVVCGLSGLMAVIGFAGPLMARPHARAIMAQKAQWGPTLERYPFAAGGSSKEKLIRVLELGRDWGKLFFGPGGGASGTSVADVGFVPSLQPWGGTPYANSVEAEMRAQGFNPQPPAVVPLNIETEYERELNELNEILDEVKATAAQLEENYAATPVPWIGAFVRAYRKHADSIKVEPVVREASKAKIKALVERVQKLDAAIKLVKRLEVCWTDAGQAKKHKEEWDKALADARATKESLWRDVDDVILAAVRDANNAAEYHATAEPLNRLSTLLALYAFTAKKEDWWKPGLRGIYEDILKQLQAEKLQEGVEKRPSSATMAEAAGRVVAGLEKALASDEKPPSGEAAPAVLTPDGIDWWTADEILLPVYDAHDVGNWKSVNFEFQGLQINLEGAIVEHWKGDFRMCNPARVNPKKYTREGAVRAAQGTVAYYLKGYMRAVAREWERKVARVRQVPKLLGVYPLRREIRARFTEDPWYQKEDRINKHLKPELDRAGFRYYHVDAASEDSVAVDEVCRMVDEFAKSFHHLGDKFPNATDRELEVGGAWWSIFTASDEPGKGFNPIAALLRIRGGVALEPPRDDRGRIVRKPDGRVDRTKPGSKPVGGIPQMTEKDFEDLIFGKEPLPADRVEVAKAPPPGAQAGGGGPGAGKK